MKRHGAEMLRRQLPSRTGPGTLSVRGTPAAISLLQACSFTPPGAVSGRSGLPCATRATRRERATESWAMEPGCSRMTATVEGYGRLPLRVDKSAQLSAEVSKTGSRRPIVGLGVSPRFPITVEVAAGYIGEAGIGCQPNRVPHAVLQGALHGETADHHLGRHQRRR